MVNCPVGKQGTVIRSMLKYLEDDKLPVSKGLDEGLPTGKVFNTVEILVVQCDKA